jgi:hypothetical protein
MAEKYKLIVLSPCCPKLQKYVYGCYMCKQHPIFKEIIAIKNYVRVHSIHKFRKKHSHQQNPIDNNKGKMGESHQVLTPKAFV